MQATVKMIGDFWYTCWIDAGQPDLNDLSQQNLSDSLQIADKKEANSWLKHIFSARDENE